MVVLSDRTLAELVSLNAHYATVKYTRDGIDYEVQLTDDEYEFYDDTEQDDE